MKPVFGFLLRLQSVKEKVYLSSIKLEKYLGGNHSIVIAHQNLLFVSDIY